MVIRGGSTPRSIVFSTPWGVVVLIVKFAEKKGHEEFLHPSLSRMQNFCIFRMFWSYSNGFLLQLLGLLIKITLLK